MSLNLGGTNCVRCKSYIFEEDDVVYCPVCGAPHHRDCYNALGHCALEELHGTENEYTRQTVEIKETEKTEEADENSFKCEMCGREYDPNSQRCPHCSAPNVRKIDGFAQFDFLGGVPADYDLGHGVTADEAKKFVSANTHRYIPKFATLNKKNKFSWNWMAFLFPSGWMLSRKMYKAGIIAAILTIAASCLGYPLTLKLYSFGFESTAFLADNIGSLADYIPQIGSAAIILAFLGTLFDLGIRIYSAIMGDYIYKNYSIGTIVEIKKQSDDRITAYRKKGGVSMLLFFLGIMIVQYGSLIVTLFIK